MVSSLMGKLFGTVLEQNLSSWAERNGIRAPSQAGFRPNFSTIDHLVTLRATAERAQGKGNALYCCFVDFKKAFDSVPREKLWQRMELLKVPTALREAIAKLYEKVLADLARNLVDGKDGNEKVTFESNIGVKQGCPLSPTLFGLFIDELEEWMRRNGGGGIQLAGYALLLLIYADDVVLLARDKFSLQKHLKALEDFCSKTGMVVNVDKTKVMIIGTRSKDAEIKFNDKVLERVPSYKYLGLEFTDNYKWNACVDKRVLGGQKALFKMQNKCRKLQLWNWRMRKFLYYTLVQPVILYGCQVWGPGLSKEMWKKVETVQKRFLIEELGAKVQTPYPILLAEAGMLPLEGEALCLFISYINRLQKLDPNRIPIRAWKATMEKGWGKDSTSWLSDWGIDMADLPQQKAAIRSLIQLKVIERVWANPKEKMKFYMQEFNPMLIFGEQSYLKENFSIQKRHLMCRFRTSSHDLEVETGRWRNLKREDRTCKLCGKGEIEDEAHVLLWCSNYELLRSNFGFHCLQPMTLYTLFAQPPSIVGKFVKEVLTRRKICLEAIQLDV